MSRRLAGVAALLLALPTLAGERDLVAFDTAGLGPVTVGMVVELRVGEDAPVCTAQVVEVKGAQATAVVLSGSATKGVRPRIIARPLKGAPIRVRVVARAGEKGVRPRLLPVGLRRQVLDWLGKLPNVVVTEGEADFLLTPEERDGQAVARLSDAAGEPLGEVAADDAEAVDKLRTAFERVTLARRLHELSNPSPPFKLTVRDPRGERAEYRVGEAMEIEVEAARACHLVLLSLGATGNLTVLLPNRYRPQSALAVGEKVRLPSPEMGFQFQASPPAGRQVLKAIATRVPLSLPELRCDDLGAAAFRRLAPEAARGFLARLAAALTTERVRDFDVVADGSWASAEWAVRIVE